MPSMAAQNSAITASGRPFPPGTSGNPGGRPRGLTALVRAETRDGAELVEFMLGVLRGRRRVGRGATPLRLRMEAAAWLADRGFGKVPQPLEHAGADGEPMRFTLVLTAAGALAVDDDEDDGA